MFSDFDSSIRNAAYQSLYENLENSFLDSETVLTVHKLALNITDVKFKSENTNGKPNFSPYLIGAKNIVAQSVKIVSGQYFEDGNHRTAVLLLYAAYIFSFNKLPKIKVYRVYAYIDTIYHLKASIKSGRTKEQAEKDEKEINDVQNELVKGFKIYRQQLDTAEHKFIEFDKIVTAVRDLPGDLQKMRPGHSRRHTKFYDRGMNFRNIRSKIPAGELLK